MTVNQEISINLEYLIGTVQDAFYTSEEYRKAAHAKQAWERSSDETRWLSHLSDREDGNWDTIRDICKVMGIDQDRLVSIGRLARKWEIKHDWQLCFPIDSHAEKIMAFILE